MYFAWMDSCIEVHKKIKRKGLCAQKYLYIIVYKYNMIKIIQVAVFSTKTVLVHVFQLCETKTSNINKQNNNQQQQ